MQGEPRDERAAEGSGEALKCANLSLLCADGSPGARPGCQRLRDKPILRHVAQVLFWGKGTETALTQMLERGKEGGIPWFVPSSVEGVSSPGRLGTPLMLDPKLLTVPRVGRFPDFLQIDERESCTYFILFF